MDYIDTSVLVAALIEETHSPRAERHLTGGHELTISEWTIAEFSSALATKLRTGSIPLEMRKAAVGALSTMMANSLIVLPVESDHFRTAARFADQHHLGLRAPDALHLAVAAAHGLTLITLDRRLATAGKALGISSRLL